MTTLPQPHDDAVSSGTAGASARREFEARRHRDEQRLRQRWGRLGGVAVALSDERQSTTAWKRGAVGEELLGARLDTLVPHGCAVLHDRRIPGSRANIDHLVVTGSAVWVIDAKRYRGRPRRTVSGGILRPFTEKLVVGRRDCTSLVAGVYRQMEVVRAVVDPLPVIGVLCFVQADWPLIGGASRVGGVHVLWPRRLAALCRRDAGTADQQIVDELMSRLVPA